MESTVFSRIKDTNAWLFQVWLSWFLAMAFTGIGIAFLPVNPWQRAFLGMGFVFSINSSFVLAKTVRDRHESSQVTARIDEARIEKILSDNHPLK
ncbi:YiaA/YiaB family inner membrane protein [Prochlorothrix hollandica]|uniref:YiaAB two helix domain-containing protein n=1 Tax=Prochlorothrix hollandica PCC 9006 = CALU 1027 TaxID=317619 RepID=A0A0M2PWB4_PROHO|nr:YiaA/YiaB family inner membrane protein [Prochlorothrix hollandica]KKI98666.1 YiaAB two helix domain-containing protein [Prochlorothrix hollandica PCC 9006 = CALU 1027]